MVESCSRHCNSPGRFGLGLSVVWGRIQECCAAQERVFIGLWPDYECITEHGERNGNRLVAFGTAMTMWTVDDGSRCIHRLECTGRIKHVSNRDASVTELFRDGSSARAVKFSDSNCIRALRWPCGNDRHPGLLTKPNFNPYCLATTLTRAVAFTLTAHTFTAWIGRAHACARLPQSIPQRGIRLHVSASVALTLNLTVC